MKKILYTLISIFTAYLSHAQVLYSTTSEGGDYGWGTICKLDLATNTLTAAFSFDVANGTQPYGSLMQASDGKLYGMTSSGGSNGFGVICSYDPATATYIKLHDFDSTNHDFDLTNYNFASKNGSNPFGSLVQASDGKLYGMATWGGDSDAGVIFLMTPPLLSTPNSTILISQTEGCPTAALYRLPMANYMV